MGTVETEPMEIGDESSSEDSDSSEDDQEQALIDRAEALEKDLYNNKYLYDTHVELVDIYRRLTDLKSMREAYERFHVCFPLTPKLWLAWIRDEIKLASNEKERKEVFNLFEKATEDYLSVELWTEYAQFSIGVSDLQTTRGILERGLTACGLHVCEGSLLWDTLRELEYAHLSVGTEGSEEWKQQVNKLAEVFRRQLSVPLLGMENTYKEWQDWYKSLPEGTIDSKPIEWGYKNALKTLETYKPFEEKLLTYQDNNEELYQVYTEYIKTLKDPSTIICLYERAVIQLCLLPNVWLDYCRYSFKLGETASRVVDRALRNCPWSEELWIAKLRILENQGREAEEILASFEQGISSIAPSPGLELWLTYLEYVHRSTESTEKLDKLFTQAIQQFGFENDPSSKLARWHARLIAKRGEMPTARKIWNNIMHNQQNKGTASVWLEYINLERQYGDQNQLRILFQRALSATLDWPQCISEEWLLYERQFGKLQDVVKCSERCQEKLKINIQTSQSQPYQQQYDSSSYDNQKGRKRKQDMTENKTETKKTRKDRDISRFQSEPKEEIRRVKKENVENRALKPASNKPPLDKDPVKTVFISNIHPHVTEEKLREVFPNALNIEVVQDRKGKSRCFGYVQFAMEEEVMTALARDREPLDGRPIFISNCKPDKNERKAVFKYADTHESNKLFVRGLPVKKSQEEIEEIFKPFGAKAVRLVLHKSGQSKGLAYVEFDDEEAAKKALKETDQMKIDEHVLTVAISAPPPKKSGVQSTSRNEEPIRHARSRLQVPLIPRSLQVKPEVKQSSNGSTDAPKAKSNADFRQMLLNK